jgi:hypothetical protein
MAEAFPGGPRASEELEPANAFVAGVQHPVAAEGNPVLDPSHPFPTHFVIEEYGTTGYEGRTLPRNQEIGEQ